MARPKSDERRGAILSAAIEVIARDGLGAATATIAKEAGISNGSLFTYFATKADLLNHAYVELKSEMASVALGDLPRRASDREQLRHMWTRWVQWAATAPHKRRALAFLDVCDDVTPASHRAAQQQMAGIADLLERCRAGGPTEGTPLGFVVALMSAVADTTIDYMAREPKRAKAHAATGFDAMCRMILA